MRTDWRHAGFAIALLLLALIGALKGLGEVVGWWRG